MLSSDSIAATASNPVQSGMREMNAETIIRGMHTKTIQPQMGAGSAIAGACTAQEGARTGDEIG
jgi:hypothetical protein